MFPKIQKLLAAVFALAILLPLLSFTITKIQPIDPKVARAEAIARIENVEDMDISSDQSLVGNANTRSLNTSIPENDVFVNGEMLVKFKTVEDKNSFALEKGASYNPAATSRLTKLKVGDNFDMKMTEDAIEILKSDSRIEYAEPNFVGFNMATVNDTYFDKQWHLENNGSFRLNAHKSYDINIKKAWDITTGSPETVIAVIDSQIDFPNAPEVADSILRDTNGKVIGKNIADNCDYTNDTGILNVSCNTKDTRADHATTAVGLIAAKTNDNSGVAGVCPNCKIMPLGIADTTPEGGQTVSRMINAITFALANGADIITSSVGYTVDPSQLSSLKTSVDNAINGGIFVVNAAGNCGYTLNSFRLKGNNCNVGPKRNSNFPICISNTATAQEKYDDGCIAPNVYVYPASFEGVISVSGYDFTGLNDAFTTNDKVTISAPATEVLTVSANSTACSDNVTSSCCADRKTLPVSLKLCYETGTSFAAPIVAGVLGLVKSKFPDATPQNYNTQMLSRESGQFVYAHNKNLIGKMGSGAIDACGALGGCIGNAIIKTGLNNFGNPYATNNLNGVGGKVGGTFPNIPLRGQTFADNTELKFVSAGCTSTDSVSGKVGNNAFIPNSGQIIPTCSSLGLQDGKLSYASNNVDLQESTITTFFTGSTSDDPHLSLSTQSATLTGTANASNLSAITLNSSNFSNTDVAELVLPGCEYDLDNNIQGKITNNNFVPNTGYKIPSCVFSGNNSATLNFWRGNNYDFGQSVGVLTNFNAISNTSSSSSSVSNSQTFGSPIGADFLDGVGGKIGSIFPLIALPGQTFAIGTEIKFIPAGCTNSTAILGKIGSNAFIPNTGQIIPSCATTGSQNGSLNYSSGNISIQTNVKTYFTSTASNDPILTSNSNTQALTGLIATNFPDIPLGITTFISTDKAEFFTAGCFDVVGASITGKVSNNTFIPDLNQKIPSCSLTQPQVGTLDVWRGDNFDFGQTIGILTKFTNSVAPTSSQTTSISSSIYSSTQTSLSSSSKSSINSNTIAPTGSGGVITIRTQQDVNAQGSNNNQTTVNVQNSSSNINYTLANTNPTVSANQQTVIVQTPKSYNNGSFKSKITIEDPYICGKGSYGNVPNPRSFGVEHVYYDFYKTGSSIPNYSYKLKLNDNGDFFLPISSSTNVIADGDYRVVYYAYDNEGNKAQGEYSDYITSDCSSSKLSQNSATIRSGGLEIISGLVVFLSLLLISLAYKSSKSKNLKFR
jgi:Subtilase family